MLDESSGRKHKDCYCSLIRLKWGTHIKPNDHYMSVVGSGYPRSQVQEAGGYPRSHGKGRGGGGYPRSHGKGRGGVGIQGPMSGGVSQVRCSGGGGGVCYHVAYPKMYLTFPKLRLWMVGIISLN